MNKEKRIINLGEEFNLRIESNSETKDKYLVLYASVFNHKSKIITEYVYEEGEFRTFYEVIETGAFDKVLREKVNSGYRDVVLDLNHNLQDVYARTKAKTLELLPDEKGLRAKAKIGKSPRWLDVVEGVERGDYCESSFIFTVNKDGQRWEYNEQEEIWYRYISEVSDLYDVCIATYAGAYSKTDIEVAERALKEHIAYKEPEVKEEITVEEPIVEPKIDARKILQLKNNQLRFKGVL